MLRSLKKSARKLREEMSENYVTDIPKEEYPYGMKLHLDNDTLKAMKIDVDEWESGEDVIIMAKATIKYKSKSADDDDVERQDMSIQVTDIEMKSVGGISLLNMRMAGKEY